MVKSGDASQAKQSADYCKRGPGQTSGCLFGDCIAADGDALLRAQEWRFLLRVQVEQARVVELFADRFVRVGIQLLLRDGGTAFPCHQLRSVVVSESRA